MIFNFIGYRLVIYVLEKKGDAKVEQRIAQTNYSEDELQTITVALNMPYQQDTHEFEKAEGTIDIGGASYHYVKRKISNGKLVLKCLVNTQKLLLNKARTAYYSFSNTNNTGNSSKEAALCSILIKAFTPFALMHHQHAFLPLSTKAKLFYYYRCSLPLTKPSGAPGQPPDIA